MRELGFIVRGQHIEKDPSCDFSKIVKGTKGYLKARIAFDGTWAGFGKVVIFKKLLSEYSAVLKNGECIIPDEALDWNRFSVSVVGSKNGVVLTTDKVVVEQEG